MSYSLTREEEYDYIRRAQAGDKRAANEFVAMQEKLIRYLIRKQFHSDKNEDDMIAEGMVGVVEAMNRFECDRGLRFSTYASFYIRMRLSNFVYSETRLGRCRHKMPLVRAKESIMARLSNGDSANDVAADHGVKVDTLRSFLDRTAQHSSFEADEKIHKTAVSDAPSEDDIINELDRPRRMKAIRDAMKGVSKRDQDIVFRRIAGETESSIAKAHGIARSRVGFIFNRKYEQIRQTLLNQMEEEQRKAS